ncbi:DUF551 domain-containing protein [Enterobacter sp. ECC-019]|uniref:DUF551 domain-containing protein n=1 Tax=Enterobacter sp. ECC-019 TaxID=3116478 RepID=UPI003754F03E
MSTITREQLRERAREKVKSLEFAVTQTAFADSRAELEEELELARIALASLEAGAVCVIDQSNLDYLKSGSDADVWPASRTEMGDVLLYRTAPPAPASVPEWTNKQCLEFLSIAFRHAEINGDLQLDDIRLGVKMINGSRAAMLQGAENSESRCTIQTAPILDSLPKNAESRCSNSPVIPDGWVACSERMPEGMTDVHISNGQDVGQGWWDGDTWQTQHDYYSVPGDVTHWMPLPAAPQQEVK